MANGATSPSRLGDINAGASTATHEDNFQLFLKKFSGEVLTEFQLANVFMPLHTTRAITSGKSAQFPVLGSASASYHTPGENILDAGNSYLSEIKHAERLISIDHVLQSSTFIPSIDELINHYDVRSMYAKELARAISKKFDENAARMAIQASRATETITGSGRGGAFINSANLGSATGTSNATAFVDALYDAAVVLADKGVSPSECVCVLPHQSYQDISRFETSLVNRDLVVSNGDYSRAEVVRVADIRLVKSTHLPTADETTTPPSDATFQRNDYNANFANTKGVVFHPTAFGTVKRQDMTTEAEYRMELQGHFMLAKMLVGSDVLRPESALELRTATPTPL